MYKKIALIVTVALLFITTTVGAGIASADPATPITVDPGSYVRSGTYIYYIFGHYNSVTESVVVPGSGTAYSRHGFMNANGNEIKSWTTYTGTTANPYQLGFDVTIDNWVSWGGFSDSYAHLPFTVTSDTDYNISGSYTTNANQGGNFRVYLKDMGTGTYVFNNGDTLGTLSGPGLTGTLPPGDYEFEVFSRSLAWGPYPWAGVGYGPISGGPDQGTGSVHLDLVGNRAPDTSGAYADQGCLWPPNHKFVDISIMGVTDPDGDALTIDVTGITSDEPTSSDKGSGGAKHAPDADGVGTDTASVRAERSGKDDGRVYVITFIASDGKGGETEGSVSVAVPHDQSKKDCSAVDNGQNYDATDIN